MSSTRDKKPGYDSEYVGCYLKIKLRGEIDHHSAAALREAIDSEIYEKRPRGLMLDMSAVDFMDSSGLGLIMGRYSVMKELGGETIVLDPSPAIERIMSLAGMERVIKVQHGNDKSKGTASTARVRRRPTAASRKEAINK